MGENFTTFEGYCNAEHILDSGQRVGVQKTALLKIRWMFDKEQSQVTHVRFCDLTVTNLKTGTLVSTKTGQSPDLPIGLLSPLEEIKGRLQGAVWMIDENKLPADQMRVYTDYRIEGVAVALSNGKEISRTKFKIFLMRDYKSIPTSLLDDVENWTVGPSALISKDGTPTVGLRDTMYDRKLGRILTVFNHGNLSIANGEIVFEELPNLREVYYLEKIDEKYKWVNGNLKRFWEYKKCPVDPLPYEYKTIYERGFTNKSFR